MNYFKCLVISAVLLLPYSCKEKEKRPEHILGHPEMAGLMAKMMIAQNKVYHEGYSGDSLQMLFHSHHKRKILQKEDISKKQFEESYTYYVSDVEKFDKLWAIVVDSLSLRNERGKAE